MIALMWHCLLPAPMHFQSPVCNASCTETAAFVAQYSAAAG